VIDFIIFKLKGLERLKSHITEKLAEDDTAVKYWENHKFTESCFDSFKNIVKSSIHLKECRDYR
jgi:hypothetical protein